MPKMTQSFKSPVRNPQRPQRKEKQSGTLNILQVPNFSFINLIMFDLDQTYRISPISSETWFRMSKMTPSFKSPVRNHQHPPRPNFSFISKIMSDLYQTFMIDPLTTTHFILNVQLHQILLVSSHEWSKSSKPPCNHCS